MLGGKPFWLWSVVFNFFFPLSIFKASFLLANFTMTFLGQWFNLRQWQASMLTRSISASHSRNMSQILLSRSFWDARNFQTFPSGILFLFFFIQLIYTMTIIIQKVTKLTYNRYGNQIREIKKVKKKYKYICMRK